MAYVVVYDACVLHDPAVRDLPVRCAGKRQLSLRARWSEAILDEVVRSILRRRPDLEEQRLERMRNLLNESLPDCLVTGYEPLVDAVHLPDPDDRHVVACAVKAQAQAIVTSNLKDFPAESLRAHDLEAVHPDEFVRGLIDLHAPTVAATFQELVGDLRSPPSTTAEAIERLRRRGLPRSADALGALLL